MSHRSTDLLIAELRQIADHARDTTWRVPLAEAGIVTFALEVLERFTGSTVRDELRAQCLRVVGNSCIDTSKLSVCFSGPTNSGLQRLNLTSH